MYVTIEFTAEEIEDNFPEAYFALPWPEYYLRYLKFWINQSGNIIAKDTDGCEYEYFHGVNAWYKLETLH